MQEKDRRAPQVRKPPRPMNGTRLSAFVIKNDATAAAPTKSHVENLSIGSLAPSPASNIDETIAFSAFSRVRRFHSRSGSILGSGSVMGNLMSKLNDRA